MAEGKDKYGYQHEDGHYSKMTGNNTNNATFSIYDKRPDIPGHKGIHINVNTDNKTFNIKEHDEKGNSSSTSGGCYLTTACMKHYADKFDDNCYYLDILRWFRDRFVSINDKREYYSIAPIIVDVLDKMENSNEIYNDIYINVIQKCVRLIENGYYSEAYNIYKSSVLNLNKKYVKTI